MIPSDVHYNGPYAGPPAEYASMRIILGSTARKGAWSVARHYDVRVVLGSVELDLRSARLGPGVTTICVDVTLGSVEIIVPPDLAVEVGMDAWGGSVEPATGFARVEPERPVVRVVGGATLASCEIVRRAA